MTVRNESVRLSLDDQFTTGMARAAAATGLLNRALHDLDGSSVGASDGLEGTRDGVEEVGQSSRRSGPEIDRLSGRLRLLADAAIALGPGLIPLGASTIPVLTASVAGLGAALVGVGTGFLAFEGLGDTLKSIDKYNLEPTAENLQAMRVELEKAGPAGAQFAQYVDDLRPKLSELQDTARSGLFPGVEEGIDSLLTRLPLVEKIVNRVSLEMGSLAKDAGDSLAGPDFRPFLDYVRREAGPVLDDFARAIGNVALGFANLLVAFDPVTQDFTGGLLDMTRAFADWSKGLDSNGGFQSFVEYVRESGPKAIDLIGSLIEAFAGVAQAAAPWGDVLLPALTAVADLLATIANSPIGTPLFTAVAAMTAFSRATDVARKSLDSFKASGDKTSTTMGSIASRAAGIAAVGVAVGAIADNINRIDASKLDASLTALGRGEVTDTITEVIDSIEQLNDPLNKVDLGEVVTAGGLFGDSSLDKFADNIDQVDKSLAELVSSGNGDQAAELFQKIRDLAAQRGINPSDTTKRFDDYTLALRNAGSAAAQSADLLSLFGQGARGAGDDARDGAAGAQAFSDALSELNGWLDKREALRSYRDGLKELAKGFKDGFGREDVENIDNVGRSITQVASLIKDRGIRADFLAGARSSLSDLANKSGPKARAEIEELIGALDRYGLTKPKTPKLDADDKPARGKVDNLKGYFQTLVGHPYTATVNANTAQASAALAALKGRMDSIQSKTVTVTVRQQGGQAPNSQYDTGGFTGRGGHLEPAGIVHRNEIVIPERYARRDFSFLRSRYPDLPGFAEGGPVGDPDRRGSRHLTLFSSPEISDLLAGAHSAGEALRALNAQLRLQQKALDRSEKALDKEASKRDAIGSQMAALSSSVSDKFSVDLGAKPSNVWAGGGGGVQGQIAQATQQAQQLPGIIAALQAAGLTGPALQQALQEMDFSQLQALAANPSQAGQLGTSLSALYAAQSTAGGAAGSAVYGAAYDMQVKAYADQLSETRGLRGDVRRLEAAVKQADKANQQSHKRNAEEVTAGVNGAAGNGHRRGKRGPR